MSGGLLPNYFTDFQKFEINRGLYHSQEVVVACRISRDFRIVVGPTNLDRRPQFVGPNSTLASYSATPPSSSLLCLADVVFPLLLLADHSWSRGKAQPAASLVKTDSETIMSMPGIVEISVHVAVTIVAWGRTNHSKLPMLFFELLLLLFD